jgi:nucleoside-diphosphate-sugar epimerase
MNILITGGAGYLGAILTEYLLNENHQVTVVDNFLYESNTLASYCYNKNFKIIKKDVRELDELEKEISESNVIIPLAALVGAPLCKDKKEDADSINYRHNFKLFKKIKKDQIVLMPTTNSAYGHGSESEVFTEESELKPISLYAKHKVDVEKELTNLNNFISLRLATVFGMSPRMRLDLLVNNFVYKALNDKYMVLFEANFKRNYIHVRDVARAFIYCINNFEKMKNQIYNLGLEEANLSKKELCEKIKKHLNFFYYEDEFQKDEDQRNYIVSNKKILDTGYITKFSLEDGIKELIEGYKGINIKSFRNY